MLICCSGSVEAKKDAVSVQVKCTPEGRTEEQLGRWHDAPTDNESRATTSLYKLAHLSARDEVRRSEQGMLHCEPEDVWDAKATYKAALQRAADADNGAPPPSRVSLSPEYKEGEFTIIVAPDDTTRDSARP